MARWFSIVMALVCCFGCTYRAPQPEWQLGRYHFNYRLEGAGTMGLIQAFDDGRRTYLHFADVKLAQECVRIREERGKLLVGALSGAYLFIKGIHSVLVIELKDDRQCRTPDVPRAAGQRTMVIRREKREDN